MSLGLLVCSLCSRPLNRALSPSPVPGFGERLGPPKQHASLAPQLVPGYNSRGWGCLYSLGLHSRKKDTFLTSCIFLLQWPLLNTEQTSYRLAHLEPEGTLERAGICKSFLWLLQQTATSMWLKESNIYSLPVLGVRRLRSVTLGKIKEPAGPTPAVAPGRVCPCVFQPAVTSLQPPSCGHRASSPWSVSSLPHLTLTRALWRPRLHQRADRMKIRVTDYEPNWSHGPQPRLTQWNYEPRRVGPPKVDRSRRRVLTKRGPLEKGMANHFSTVALRTPWTVWKGKNDTTLKDELPRLIGAQYATGED